MVKMTLIKRKSGTIAGQNDQNDEKWVSHSLANPLILLVGQGRIELPTLGFSVPSHI